MRNADQIIARCDLYKKQLLLAIEEKTLSPVADPALDMLILSLIDKLEALDWVLNPDNTEEENIYFYGDNGENSSLPH